MKKQGNCIGEDVVVLHQLDRGEKERKLKYLGIKSSMAPSKQFMNSTYNRADLLESRQTLPDIVNMIIQFKGIFI